MTHWDSVSDRLSCSNIYFTKCKLVILNVIDIEHALTANMFYGILFFLTLSRSSYYKNWLLKYR
jgi:hypothetical protein